MDRPIDNRAEHGFMGLCNVGGPNHYPECRITRINGKGNGNWAYKGIV